MRASVLTHLQRMCRTRQGSVPSAMDYGLPDLSEIMMSAPEVADAVARALKHSLDRYEPRLTNVKISRVAGESWDQLLKFQIHAELIIGRTRERVSFETRIDPTRRVEVT